MSKTETRVTMLKYFIMVLAGGSLLYGFVNGYFDKGTFKVRQLQWSSSKRVAIVGECSDDAALGGLEYFVVISSHALTTKELQLAYYSKDKVFDSSDNCINVSWQGPTTLVITCTGHEMESLFIGLREERSGQTVIRYENIPEMKAYGAASK